MNHNRNVKFFCVGRNYADHAAELGNAIPEAPVVFLKPATALLPAGAPFRIPSFSTKMHYEGELVFRFGAGGKNISPEEALSFLDAMTVGIDFTERDLQDNQKQKGLPWEISKAFDESAVLGEWQPLQDPKTVSYELLLNDQIMQVGDPNLMLYSIPTQIAYISQFFTIETGDVLFTGTPKGVEAVRPGDRLEGRLNGQRVLLCEIKGEAL